MSKFTFHNVGHGLFYTGELNNATNFVFDCGSRCQNCATNAITTWGTNRLNNGNIDIDFVVISHLHTDHFCGLPLLLNTYQVRKIYMPYLDFANNGILSLLTLFESGLYEVRGRSSEYALTPKEEYRVIHNAYMGLIERSGRIEENAEINIDRFSFTNRKHIIPNSDWHFELFSRQYHTLRSTQNQRSLWAAINSLTGGDLVGYIRINQMAGLSNIYNIYDRTFYGSRGQNATSLVLLHYPKSNYAVPTRKQSLLTGDTVFDKTMRTDVYTALTHSHCAQCIFQIPHHGALMNWGKLYSRRLPNIKAFAKAFIVTHFIVTHFSSSCTNPHQIVLSDIATLYPISRLYQVTELLPSLYSYTI